MSSSTIARCNACEDDATRFRVPWDEVGMVLMREHLKDVHGITPPSERPKIGSIQ